MMNGYRRAALKLRTLGAADRSWLLGQLLPEERARIAALLEELSALHPDAEMQTLSDAVQADLQDATSDDPPLPHSPAALVSRAQPERIAHILAYEPDWLVGHLCAIARWPWLPAFLEKLERARATRIAGLMNGTSPAKRVLDNALVAAVAARLEDDSRHNGFDALLTDEQQSEPRPGGLRRKLARWLR